MQDQSCIVIFSDDDFEIQSYSSILFFFQETNWYGTTIKVHEAVGVVGIACPDNFPLLAFISLVLPAISRGNTVVVLPSEKYPIVGADMYQVGSTDANNMHG